MKRVWVFVMGFMLLSAAVVMDSCKKDRIKGCTDPDSVNYNELAEKDNGSCRYEGKVVFWYDEAASAGLTGDGATALTFYLNNEVVGSSNTQVFWAEAPDCGQDGSITATQDLGKNKSQDYTLSVKDQESYEYWHTTFTMEANTCVSMQLTWEMRKKK